LEEDVRRLYFPGILRVLDIEGHEDEIPTTRTHEIFIPLRELEAGRPRLDVTEALASFHSLADERTDAETHLPFHLKGANRDNKGRIRLQAGDLVFFDLDEKKPGRVKELAISSIWRKSAGHTFDYFPPELLPFHPEREAISIAERLFGFVEQGQVPPDRPARALASRVRISYGRLERGQDHPWYVSDSYEPLKILSTPKPPSPALYFREKDGGAAQLRKADLNPRRHEPQGRKFYLHQRPEGEPWRRDNRQDPDKRWQLRGSVQPLRRNLSFLAHLDFDNLTERELALLIYALRPTRSFRHKLGMGKPLGLGSLEIAPLGLFLVDREKRYGGETDLFGSSRYHRTTMVESLPAAASDRYREEAAAQGLGGGPDLDRLRASWRAGMASEVRWALESLGDPDAVIAPVLYPRTHDQADPEEGYHWFVRNEKDREFASQQLEPVVPPGSAGPPQHLPVLTRTHAPVDTAPRGRQGGGAREPQRGPENVTREKKSPGGLGSLRQALQAALNPEKGRGSKPK
jgi:hypothetical protein